MLRYGYDYKVSRCSFKGEEVKGDRVKLGSICSCCGFVLYGTKRVAPADRQLIKRHHAKRMRCYGKKLARPEE